MTRARKSAWLKRLIGWAIALAIIAALVVFVFIPIYTKSDDQNLKEIVLRSNSEVRLKQLERDLLSRAEALAGDGKAERRRNKRGLSYGMAVSCYQKPEELWGYEYVTSAYKEVPLDSAERIFKRAKEMFPEANDAALRKVLK